MISRPIAWRWGDVDARLESTGLRLTHASAKAELLVRAGRLVRGVGYATASSNARSALARVGAIVLLRARGRYFVHASGVVDPTGRAWLFAGDSGSGKSTLAYALARQGWRVLGDDGVLMEITGESDGEESVRVHAWRAPLQVSGELMATFPELGPIVTRTPPAPGDPRMRVAVRVASARSGLAAAIVFVARAPGSRLTRLGASAALASLVRQSPWVMLPDARARAHLATLRAVVERVPVFRLEHSRAELGSIARILERADS